MNCPFHRLATILALLGICTSTVLAAAPTTSRDLSLTKDRQLQGQVVNVQGQGVAGLEVEISAANGLRRVVKTDKEGKFSFTKVEGGLYQLAAAGRGGLVRVWRSDLAPPKAHDGALIIQGDEVARGEFLGGNGFFSNPLCLTLLVAGAIAIPLALDNDGS